uniref:Putative upregulated during skeletal muscle growth 5 variant 3 n=1 Tax=Taeniopygia guttata TaxID=59729 RepID=B5FZ18_TAEGU|nr:putative upregulated during skeletal muscle growth 5 variant 3 [Taeniopygia guttata]
MAGHDSGTQHQFTGFQKYFNSYTTVGRRNLFCFPVCNSNVRRCCTTCLVFQV